MLCQCFADRGAQKKSLKTTDPEESPLPAAPSAQKLRKSSCYSSARCHPCKAEGRVGKG